MTHLFFFSTVATIFSAFGLLACILLVRTSRSASHRLLEVTRGAVRTPQRSSVTIRQNLFSAASWVRARFGIQENEKLLARFAQAGYRAPVARDVYFAVRILGPLAGVGLASLLPSSRIFWMTALGGVSYLAPDFILNRIIKSRREKIRQSIPDAIDLLVICVDAGLGLDQAMMRVGQELVTSHPAIYEEFMQINREQRAGLLRLAAWQAMAQRSQLPEIDGFVNMLMQTERFGTPIARALSTYGDNIRLKRRQRAEELAAKTTVKIIFPLVLFIFPSMFIVLLGPAVMTIMRGFGSMPQ